LTGEVEAFVNISPMQFPLHPGDKLTDYADLSKLFDLGKPGKYLISVERINPYSKDAKGVVKSNTVVLTVTE
jgi:hypothetical protein